MSDPRDGAEQIVLSVQRDPQSALRRASALLAGELTGRERVVARWAVGMARRELGDLDAARTDLERAWESATVLGDMDLASQIAITLSLVVAYQGELRGALAILDVSEPSLAGAARGRLRSQRGIVLYQQGRLDESMVEYEAAAGLLAEAGDLLGEARVHVNYGGLLSYLGRLDEARAHLETGVAQGAQLGATLLQGVAEQNLAHIGALAGDFPAAFEAFERADGYFTSCGYDGPMARSLRLDHARALLQANLLEEATELADRAVLEAEETEGDLDVAESLLVAAQARLASGDVAGGIEAAEQSVEGFTAHRRPAWAALARSVVLRARAEAEPTPVLAGELAANATELEQLGYRMESLRAKVLAAEVLVGHDDLDGADALMKAAARAVRTSVVHQPSALRVRALIEMARANHAGARRAVNLGVRILNDHQAVLGAIELRAYAAANSDGLARIGVQLAIDDGRPRELLAHLEATRRTTSLLPAARPPDDDALAELLAQLRLVTTRHRDAVADGSPRADLDRRRTALERQIRGHVRRARTVEAPADVPLDDSLRTLGDRALIEYANLDGTLFAVSVVGNRAALHELGPIDGLTAEIDSATMALHRLNRAQGSAASRAAATETLGDVAASLADRLLPARLRRSSRPIVIVPTGVLHGLPWGIVPDLRERPLSVTPSLTGWAVARRRDEAAERVVLIAGPMLDHADEEVAALATIHDGATVLVGGAATGDRCLDALGRCDLAHLACHGAYRADNPLFSTLRLADGALTVYDLERCKAMPRTVVLSACNAAMGASLLGGSLLGLASSLMTLGAGTIVAPLTPVSDERVVDVMTTLHAALLRGQEPSEALATARSTGDVGTIDPTAAAFVAIGA